MTPLATSRNFAARMGRWSAQHRKIAIFGWLAFVVVAVALGSVLGTTYIDKNDTNVGEARQADHMIRDAGFNVDEQTEYVLIQSKTHTASDPEFRAVIQDTVAALARFEQV